MKHQHFPGKIFHFSGGPSSALMVLDNYQPGDIVIFCDTGREDPDTYRFIRQFSIFENIPVVWLHTDWRTDVIKKQQCIPNRQKRQCTIELKIKRARRYLRSIGLFRYTQCIGFRADEKSRVDGYKNYWKAVTTVFPLYAAGIREPEVDLRMAAKPYRLTIPKILKNCDLCFQKGEAAIMAIIQDKPTRADKWIEDEENRELNPNGYTYFPGKTMRQLRDAALQLKTKYDLHAIKPAFTCSCTA